MKFKLYRSQEGAHVHIRVFVGKDDYHMALAGRLTMSPEEASNFSLTLKDGARAMQMIPVDIELVGGIEFNTQHWIKCASDIKTCPMFPVDKKTETGD